MRFYWILDFYFTEECHSISDFIYEYYKLITLTWSNFFFLHFFFQLFRFDWIQKQVHFSHLNIFVEWNRYERCFFYWMQSVFLGCKYSSIAIQKLILHEMFEETFPNGVEKWKLVVLDGWCYLEFYFMRIFMERSVSNLPNPLINT